MKNVIIIFVVFLWISDLVAQNSDIVFSTRVSYLPSSVCRYEYYIQKGHKVKHKYDKEANNCWDMKFNKGRKIDSISLITISDFISDMNSKDTFKIHLSERIKDSLTDRILINSRYFKNDSLSLIFSNFESEYYKPDSSMFGLFPRFEGIQIDGSWLSTTFVHNKDTLLSVHKSYSGYPRILDCKEWLILYFIYRKYMLFQDIQITPYLSEEHYLYLLRLYLKTMKN